VLPLPNGGVRVLDKGRKIKFRGHRAEIDLEDYWLLAIHPAFTGDGEPRLVFLEDEGRFIDTSATGVQVVDGATTSASRRRTPPPIQGWDTLTYAQLRKLIADGIITSPLDALIYERQHRNREGMLQLLLAAAQGAELPSTRAMTVADKKAAAKQAAQAGGDPIAAAEVELPEHQRVQHEPVQPVMVESDEDIRAEIEAALAADGDGLSDPIAEDADEPIPGEGVQ
jgi:hypothetical protein